jgi:hypothetical protein
VPDTLIGRPVAFAGGAARLYLRMKPFIDYLNESLKGSGMPGRGR